MSDQYDAIVVGARCAGATTAMLLARRGYRVLVVDRQSFLATRSQPMSSTLPASPHSIVADSWTRCWQQAAQRSSTTVSISVPS